MSVFTINGLQADSGIAKEVSYTLTNPADSGQSSSSATVPDHFVISVSGTIYYYQKIENQWISARTSQDNPQGPLEYFEVNFGKVISRLLPLSPKANNPIKKNEYKIKELISEEREKQAHCPTEKNTNLISSYTGTVTEAQQKTINDLLKKSSIEKPDNILEVNDTLEAMKLFLKPENINKIKFFEQLSERPSIGAVHDYLLHQFAAILDNASHFETLTQNKISPYFYNITVGELSNQTAIIYTGLDEAQYAIITMLVRGYNESLNGATAQTFIEFVVNSTPEQQEFYLHLLDTDSVKTESESVILQDFTAIASASNLEDYDHLVESLDNFMSRSKFSIQIGINKRNLELLKIRQKKEILESNDIAAHLKTLNWLELHEIIMEFESEEIKELASKVDIMTLTEIPGFLSLGTLENVLINLPSQTYHKLKCQYFLTELSKFKSFEDLVDHRVISSTHFSATMYLIKDFEIELNEVGMTLACTMHRLAEEQGLDHVVESIGLPIAQILLYVIPLQYLPLMINTTEEENNFIMPFHYSNEMLLLTDFLHKHLCQRSFIEALCEGEQPKLYQFIDLLNNEQKAMFINYAQGFTHYINTNERFIEVGTQAMAQMNMQDIIDDTYTSRWEVLSNIFKYCTPQRAARLLQETGPVKNLLIALLPTLDSIHSLMVELPRDNPNPMDPVMLHAILDVYQEIKNTMNVPYPVHTYNQNTAGSSRADAMSDYEHRFKLEMTAYFGEDVVEASFSNRVNGAHAASHEPRLNHLLNG